MNSDVEDYSKIDFRMSHAYRSISPLMFGGFPSNDSVDNTKAILKAIAKAKEFDMALDLRRGPWRIKESLDLTDIKQIITDWSGRFIIDPTDLKTSNLSRYAIIIGDPDKSFREKRAQYNSVVGVLAVFSENRKSELNGVYIKGSLLSIDSIRVMNFNGAWITISSTWDSTIKSLSAELSGNLSEFQIGIFSGGDTSNCLSISRIQSERAFHKCLSINCIRSVINNIHAERTRVLTEDDGSNKLKSGLKYVNVSINIGNSIINQLVHDNITSNKNESLNSSSVVLNIDHSSISEIHMVRSIVSSSFGRDSVFDNVYFLSWYFSRGIKRCMINNSTVTNTLELGSKVKLNGGNFKKIVLSDWSSSLIFDGIQAYNVQVNGNAENSYFNNCTIMNELTFSEAKRDDFLKVPITFVDTNMDCTLRGTECSRASFIRGYIKDVNLHSTWIYFFQGVNINNFDFEGTATFVTRDCRANHVKNWSIPDYSGFPAGTITERLGQGTGRVFIFDPDDSSDWNKII